MPHAWRIALCLIAWSQSTAIAGEIPGVRSSFPPYLERDIELNFSNDFLGRGGSVDDFRTQQIIVSANLSDRWQVLLDHSVLTRKEPNEPARIDQLSGSLGYRLVDTVDILRTIAISAGLGFRSSGDFSGERMQNGFHRLVGSDIETLPYTGLDGTDLTAWFDADYYRVLREAHGAGLLGSWRFGSWLRGSSLVTSDGQWDSSAALFAVANRSSLDFWFGLRRDWRAGYDDPVLREAAAAEDDIAVVLGMRIGALVLETVQQLNNDASYGQLRLVSGGASDRSVEMPPPRIGLETGFVVPDVHLHAAGRLRTALLTGNNSAWRESAFASVVYGEPQHRDSNAVYVRSLQLGIGLEWERSLSAGGDWLSAYASVGAGWRDEKLIGDGALQGLRSDSVSRAVLLIATGLRFDAARLGGRWHYRIQLGALGRLPAGDAELQIGGMSLPVQKPSIDLSLGMTFDTE